MLRHGHKKRKDSLETQTELAALRSYVENQPILEPILLGKLLIQSLKWLFHNFSETHLLQTMGIITG